MKKIFKLILFSFLMVIAFEFFLPNVKAVQVTNGDGETTSAKYLFPVAGKENEAYKITQYFPSGHGALDIAPYGNNIPALAACSGKAVIVKSNWSMAVDGAANGTNGSYGNFVKIKCDDNNYTLYAHLASTSVNLNDSVKKGDKIGIIGNTGRSFGEHLHFEVRDSNNNTVDPLNGYVSTSNPTPSASGDSDDDKPSANGVGNDVEIDVNKGEKTHNWNMYIDPAAFCTKTSGIWYLVGYALFALKIIVPLLVIILGVVDFFKAVMASDDKAIKTSAMTILQRLIMGVIIFFVPTIVSLVLGLVTDKANQTANTAGCWKCLLEPFSNDCKTVKNASKK